MNRQLLDMPGLASACQEVVFLSDGCGDAIGIELHAVVGEQVDLPLEQAGNQAAPAVAAAPDAGELANSPVAVEVDLVSAVAVTHPNGRDASDDVVVVHPAVMGDFGVADVFFAAD